MCLKAQFIAPGIEEKLLLSQSLTFMPFGQSRVDFAFLGNFGQILAFGAISGFFGLFEAFGLWGFFGLVWPFDRSQKMTERDASWYHFIFLTLLKKTAEQCSVSTPPAEKKLKMLS